MQGLNDVLVLPTAMRQSTLQMAESPVRNHRKYLQHEPHLFVFIGFARYEWNRLPNSSAVRSSKIRRGCEDLLRVQAEPTASKVRLQEAEAMLLKTLIHSPHHGSGLAEETNFKTGH